MSEKNVNVAFYWHRQRKNMKRLLQPSESSVWNYCQMKKTVKLSCSADCKVRTVVRSGSLLENIDVVLRQEWFSTQSVNCYHLFWNQKLWFGELRFSQSRVQDLRLLSETVPDVLPDVFFRVPHQIDPDAAVHHLLSHCFEETPQVRMSYIHHL